MRLEASKSAKASEFSRRSSHWGPDDAGRGDSVRAQVYSPSRPTPHPLWDTQRGRGIPVQLGVCSGAQPLQRGPVPHRIHLQGLGTGGRPGVRGGCWCGSILMFFKYVIWDWRPTHMTFVRSRLEPLQSELINTGGDGKAGRVQAWACGREALCPRGSYVPSA